MLVPFIIVVVLGLAVSVVANIAISSETLPFSASPISSSFVPPSSSSSPSSYMLFAKLS